MKIANKVWKIGRLSFVIYPKQKKVNPYAVRIEILEKEREIVLSIARKQIRERDDEIQRLQSIIVDNKSGADYYEYCRAFKEKKYYPDPRD